MIIHETIQKLDASNMLGSIDMLAKQIEHAWEAAGTITIPDDYKNVNKIVVFGMGGSALASDIVQHLFANQLTIPLLTERDYHIPAYVDDKTLVVLSSYSGTTEETLTVTKDILFRTKKIVVITTGGGLKDFHEHHQLPAYIIEPTYNPCNQPRIAVGYAVVGLMRLFSSIGLLQITTAEINDVIHYLDGNRELLRDLSSETAQQIYGHIPMYVGSEFLLGNLHALSNQTNENGKNFGAYFSIPELNHHLMEGLGNPSTGVPALHFVLIESNFYHARVLKRFQVMKQILDKQHLSYGTFIATAPTQLQQSFEVLQWGSYVSFYLAMLNHIDPSPIPWVDYFKHALKA